MPTRVHTLVRSRLLPILALVVIAIASVAATSHIPTVSIDSVAVGESVTIRTHNFPPNQTFTVTMGPMGTRGINGTVVGTLQSGAGGTLTATYTIPDGLKDDAQVSIRLQTGHSNPWYAYNYFNNGSGATTPTNGTTPVYAGIPTFRITSVEAGNSVTIETSNFPANQTFTVTMGKMFTRGIGGTVVGTLESGAGGALTATYAIPAALQGDSRIAIRAQTSHSNPYYAYNWFWNSTTDGDDGRDDGDSGTGGIPGYVGIPTFTVCSVTQNDSVTIVTRNFPPNQTFSVTMGPMFSRGIGGTVVGTLNSGEGGRLVATYDIPEGLQGSYRIAIRTQTAHTNPYYAYNWFWNSTATVCPTE